MAKFKEIEGKERYEIFKVSESVQRKNTLARRVIFYVNTPFLIGIPAILHFDWLERVC